MDLYLDSITIEKQGCNYCTHSRKSKNGRKRYCGLPECPYTEDLKDYTNYRDYNNSLDKDMGNLLVN